MDNRRLLDRYALPLVLLLALALRLALWAQPLHTPANDEVEYIAVARDLLAGRGWVFYESYHWLRAPLYPLFLAGSLWLAGGDLHRAALPNIALSVGLIWLIYLLARELDGGRWTMDGGLAQVQGSVVQPSALLAALLAALLLTNATFASLYMSEVLFACLFAASFLLLLRWRRLAVGRWADWRLLLAGLYYGLAVLTRSAPLFFLPVVLAWVAYVGLRRQGEEERRRRGDEEAGNKLELLPDKALPVSQSPSLLVHPLLPALAFALVVILTIAPWTIRNCRAYGSCILVETGLSYNLWAFSEPRESQEQIFSTLAAIPNPADRSAEATRRGLARLREEPAIVARKLWPNWVYIWRVKPIQDRFLQVSYRADPPASLFIAALLLDDLLMLVIIVAGLAGLGWQAARGRPAALLCGLWVAYFVSVTMLTHGEARYRHFILFALIPYAALALTARPRLGRTAAPVAHVLRGAAVPLLAASLAFFVGYTFLRAYPYDYALGGAARSLNRISGDTALAWGDITGAEAAYRRALAASETPDGWLALARVHAARGEVEQQADAYSAASVLALSYPLPHALLGDLLRRESREAEARRAFIGRYVAESTMATWSWEQLRSAPSGPVDLGAGLDFGYFTGLYDSEQLRDAQARWSGPNARLRLPGAARVLRLRVAAPRPASAPVQVAICASAVCQTFSLGPDWQILSLSLPPAAGPLREVELRVPTFQAEDGRTLGLIIDWFAADGSRD